MSTYPANLLLPQSSFLVSRWPLDEASGNRADIVGSNTLTDVNTVAAGSGLILPGARFDNSADFERDNSEQLSGGDILDTTSQDFCFFAFVSPESAPSASRYIIASKYGAAGNKSCLF
jgi:hypothetical protein